MATISNPKLAVQENLPGGKVKVDVTCTVTFTAFEKFTMDHGVKFSLACRLWGADAWPNPDDSLYTFPRKLFPDATPTLVEQVTFTATMSHSVLNEDDYIGNRTDEVYAGLTLTNLETNAQVRKTTNQLSHNF